MSTHEEIVANYEAYLSEHANFEEKGVKASAARARKALGSIGKLSNVKGSFFFGFEKKFILEGLR